MELPNKFFPNSTLYDPRGKFQKITLNLTKAMCFVLVNAHVNAYHVSRPGPCDSGRVREAPGGKD